MAEPRGFEREESPLRGVGSLLGGSALTLYGLTRARGGAVPLTLAGLGLAAFGAASRYARTDRVHASRSVTVHRAVEEVYGFWSGFERIPRVMKHLTSVKRTGENRYRFRLSPPMNSRTIEWESEVVEDRPNELISWQSVPDSPVHHAGSVRFRPVPGGRGTEVQVDIDYQPGSAGMAVLGRFLRPAAAQGIKEDIRSFKAFMEAGEIATIESQPAARGA